MFFCCSLKKFSFNHFQSAVHNREEKKIMILVLSMYIITKASRRGHTGMRFAVARF